MRRSVERELALAGAFVLASVFLAAVLTRGDLPRELMDTTARLCALPERPAIWFLDRIRSSREWFLDRRALLVENAALRDENSRLKLHLGRGAVMEANAVAAAHALPGSTALPVIYRDPAAWWSELKIATNGTEVPSGKAVLDGSSLVGMTLHSDERGAWVRLITSAAFFVPVLVTTTREIAVASGDDDGGVWLRYLPSERHYEQGIELVTAMGGALPAGIPVGVVSGQIRTSSSGLIEYRITPGADLFRISSVSLRKEEP